MTQKLVKIQITQVFERDKESHCQIYDYHLKYINNKLKYIGNELQMNILLKMVQTFPNYLRKYNESIY